MRRIIHKVKSWIRGTPASPAAGLWFVYVLQTPKHGPAELAAGDQLAILRRLSSFAGKEDARVTAVFPGKPLRKIPDGASSNGVSVRYATSEQLRKLVEEVAAECRKQASVVVVTDDLAIEKRAHSTRLRTLRLSTFEKTLDAVAGPLRKEQREPRRPPQPPSAPRSGPAPAAEPPEPQSQPPNTDDAAPNPPPQPPPQQPPAPRRQEPTKQDRDSAILDLIDPL